MTNNFKKGVKCITTFRLFPFQVLPPVNVIEMKYPARLLEPLSCLSRSADKKYFVPFSFPFIGFHDRSVGRKKLLALILPPGVCDLPDFAIFRLSLHLIQGKYLLRH